MGLRPLGRTFAVVFRRKDGWIYGLRAICGLLQPLRSLEMTKRIHSHAALEDFETKAQEFISLTFDISEQELRLHRRHRTQHPTPRREALQFAALTVRNSIKAFLAIVKIEAE